MKEFGLKIYGTITIVRIRLQKPNLTFLSVVALFVLLVTLAVLQYRWIGQTSDGEHDKMREKARIAAENLSRDFDRELTRAFLQLLVDPVSFSKKDWNDYALRYERWSATAPYPKLITNVFIAEKDSSGRLVLSVYNETNNRFEETAWLPQLARVQSEIERDLNGSADGTKKTNPSEMVAPDVPALVISVSRVNLADLKTTQNTTKPTEPLNIDSSQRAGYTIVLLNLEYIKSELLPALAARYFNVSDKNTGNDNYNVIVANRSEPPQIIYHSGSSLVKMETPIESDIQLDLFALRFDEIESLMPIAPRRQTQPSKNGDGKSRRDVANVVVASPSSDNQKGGWQLFVQYRGGSLEAAIESMQQRNLLSSFGVLLLLAANGILLIILLNRARRLVSQQANFVASVTHELRTPLAVIRATSENIADQIITDAAQIKEYGLIINTEERRLTAMIEQLLEFTGAQNVQNSTYKHFPENVDEIIEAALGDYRTELKQNGFCAILEVEPDLPQILADREALARAVGNLIGNAVKHNRRAIGEKRQIKIRAQKTRDEISKEIEIAVQDYGDGIEKKELPQVFELFYRGQSAIEDQIKGSGIGLSIVKQIVEAHGGTVSVVSKPNQGSTFTMRLPAMDDADFIQ